MSPRKYIRPAACIALGLCLLACSTTPRPSLRSALAGIPAKNLSGYNFDPTTRLEDRVTPAPAFVLKHLRDMDKTEAYTSYQPTAEEKEELRTYLGLLPKDYGETLQQRLVGIYFINNLIGSGMADYVLGDGDKLSAILIINPETMRHSISEWLTYRESTAFEQQGDDQRISVDCGDKYTGLMYVLLHETSHIMDYVHRYTPFTEDAIRELGLSASRSAFTDGIWTAYDTPAVSFDFPGRRDISFYNPGGKPLLSLSKAAAIYAGLTTTPFVSLYGSLNWAEDFAEYATWSHFTTELQQPYRIVLSRKGAPDTVVEPTGTEQVQKRVKPLAQQ